MDEKLFVAATEGKEEYFNEVEVSASVSPIGTPNSEGIPDERYFLTQTSDGDNLLHLAASRDRLGFIVKALQKIPAVVLLICWGNSHGENPLHVTARSGQLDIVQVLVNSYKSHLNDVKEGKVRSTLLSLMVAEGVESPEPWRAQDSRGNTPLHEALKHGYEEVAMYFLEIEPSLASYHNNANEGVLYLAAAYGHEHVLDSILTSAIPYSLSAPVGLTPLHAAVDNCSEGATKLLIKKHPELAKIADKRNRTALYYAAQANKVGHVEAMLKAERSCAYIRDETGLTPLLRAAGLGQLQAVQAILHHCPESLTICDSKGRSVLHLVQLRSYQDGMELLNKTPSIKKLINKMDMEGNSPLHLAALNCDHIVAKVILDTDKVGVTLQNKEGSTPWDIIKLQPELSEEMAEVGYQLVMHSTAEQSTQPQIYQQTPLRIDDTFERIQRKFNTLGLTAVVLAAITFAAGFTVAGGIDRNGHAVLTRQAVFNVFILSNTAAMCGYTIVLSSALWAMMIAHRDDEPRFLLSFSVHILQLSFYATLIAFVSSIYALASTKSLWLAIVVVCLPSCSILLTISRSFVFRLARNFRRIRF